MASANPPALLPIPVGMDIGTCNTVLSYIPRGADLPKTIPAKTGLHLHPSALYYSEDPNKPNLYGQAALDKAGEDGNLVTCPKRGLGVTSCKLIKNDIHKSFTAKMTTKGQAHPKFAIRRDGKDVEVSSVDVIAELLTDYKRLITAELPNEEIGVVISVPEMWAPAQVNQMAQALKMAGIKPMKIISEPAAAHIAYKCSPKPEDMEVFFVVDLGDGTMDSSLMQDTGLGVYKTMGVGGNESLGSRDVDHYLLNALKQEIIQTGDPSYNEGNWLQQETQLKARMKELKHKISELDDVTETFFGIITTPFKFKVDKAKKLKILGEFYDNFRAAIINVFTEAAVEGVCTPDQMIQNVHGVIIVGGGMRDRVLTEEILPSIFKGAKMLGKYGEPGTINADVVVSFGCAQWAATLIGTPLKHGLPSGAAIMRVLPRDLGIETVMKVEGKEVRLFSPIFKAQTGFPIAKSEDNFMLSFPGQRDIQISIFQGKGRYTSDLDMVKLGSFIVPLDGANPEPKIVIEFEIDDDCVLTVNAIIDDGDPNVLAINLET